MPDATIHPTPDDLCRAARALRARHAGAPRELHAALERLTVRLPTTRIAPSPAPPPPEIARMRLAREVLERLDGPILRYSMRLDLYRLARRLGISTFDASLIIAQVQHAAASRSAVETPEASTGHNPDRPDAGRAATPLALLAALLTQAAIVGAGWAIFG